MNMKWMIPLCVILAVPLAAQAAGAKASSQDREWLVATHQTNLSEIASGKLAAKSGNSQAVRSAGQTLASDHESLDAKLKPVARQLGVKLPDHPNSEQREEMQRFRNESGGAFDKDWARSEADGHEKSIKATQREIRQGRDTQVKQLASSALPVLEKHLRDLREVASKVSGG